jgi:hypothetical protein
VTRLQFLVTPLAAFLPRPKSKPIALPVSGVAIARAAERELLEERRRDLAFYFGDQWPAEAKAARLAQGRPCLVFNRIPGIVHAITAKRQGEGRGLTMAQTEDLMVEVVRKTRDSQIMLNYLRSTQVELVNSRFFGTIETRIDATGALSSLDNHSRMVEREMQAAANRLA